MRYILRTDQPFRGVVQSFLTKEGLVEWTGGLTLDEYAKERGFPVRAVDDAEFDRLNDAFLASQISDPVEETGDAYNYALECLPPCRWKTVCGVEMFHISERLSADLVSWHAELNGRFFTFTDHAGADMAALAAKVAAKEAATSEVSLDRS